jgi:hypothetical protein
MKTRSIAGFVVLALLVVVTAVAATSRTYDRSIELVWDEAVKASRDAELVVTESDREEHRFRMKTPKKALSKSVSFEVRLAESGSGTAVTVTELDDPGSTKSAKAIAAFFEALDARMR